MESFLDKIDKRPTTQEVDEPEEEINDIHPHQ